MQPALSLRREAFEREQSEDIVSMEVFFFVCVCFFFSRVKRHSNFARAWPVARSAIRPRFLHMSCELQTTFFIWLFVLFPLRACTHARNATQTRHSPEKNGKRNQWPAPTLGARKQGAVDGPAWDWHAAVHPGIRWVRAKNAGRRRVARAACPGRAGTFSPRPSSPALSSPLSLLSPVSSLPRPPCCLAHLASHTMRSPRHRLLL
jgi:hypothetical protein